MNPPVLDGGVPPPTGEAGKGKAPPKGGGLGVYPPPRGGLHGPPGPTLARSLLARARDSMRDIIRGAAPLLPAPARPCLQLGPAPAPPGGRVALPVPASCCPRAFVRNGTGYPQDRAPGGDRQPGKGHSGVTPDTVTAAGNRQTQHRSGAGPSELLWITPEHPWISVPTSSPCSPASVSPSHTFGEQDPSSARSLPGATPGLEAPKEENPMGFQSPITRLPWDSPTPHPTPRTPNTPKAQFWGEAQILSPVVGPAQPFSSILGLLSPKWSKSMPDPAPGKVLRWC